MIPDLDIYRSANVLIREHGDDTAIEAAKYADAMLAKGITKLIGRSCTTSASGH
jgi:hypothetical protein